MAGWKNGVSRSPPRSIGSTATAVSPANTALPKLAAIARVETTIFEKGRESRRNRHYVSSRPLDAAAFGQAIRAHRQIENALHWVLDVSFKEDATKTRNPNGPKNAAVVRHFALALALALVRAAGDDRSIKLRRRKAHRDPGHLARILNARSLTRIQSRGDGSGNPLVMTRIAFLAGEVRRGAPPPFENSASRVLLARAVADLVEDR